MIDPIVKVIWKDEGDYGPIFELTQSDLDAPPDTLGRPFDPNREPPKWYSRAEAEAIAQKHGARFEES